MNQAEVNALFQRLGVVRWDTSPPQDGAIAWYDAAGQKVAWGRYRAILSFGPGTEFTMAWAMGAGAGVPFVPKQGDDLAKSFLATEAQAWEKALSVASVVGARFAYRCASIYVAVDEFQVDGALAALVEPPPLVEPPVTKARPPATKARPPVTKARPPAEPRAPAEAGRPARKKPAPRKKPAR